MSKRKSILAQRRPIGSFGRLAADLAKYGLNDLGELRLARQTSDLMRAAKRLRASGPTEAAATAKEDPVEQTAMEAAFRKALDLTPAVPLLPSEIDIAPHLRQGGVAVVVGGRTTNFSEPMRRHPQLVFWDSTDPKSDSRDLPANAKVVFITKWISHARETPLRKMARDRGLLCPAGFLSTGDIRAVLDRFIAARAARDTPPQVVQISNVLVAPSLPPPPPPPQEPELPIEEVSLKLRSPRQGEMKTFVLAHADRIASPADEARRLMPVLNERGVSTSYESLAQAVRNYRSEIPLTQRPATSATAPEPEHTPPRSAVVVVVTPPPPEPPAPPAPPPQPEPMERQADILLEALAEAEQYANDMRASAELLQELMPKLKAEVQKFRDGQRRMVAARRAAKQALEFLE